LVLSFEDFVALNVNAGHMMEQVAGMS